MACKQLKIEEYQDLIRRNPQAVGYAEGQCDCAVLCFKYQEQGVSSTQCIDCALPESAGNRNCSVQTDGTGLDRTTGTYRAFPEWYCQGIDRLPGEARCYDFGGCCDDPPSYEYEEGAFVTITVAGACAECG